MKKLNKEEYVKLCEKEALVVFMSEHCPFATFRRIGNGRNRGKYEVTIRRDKKPQEEFTTRLKELIIGQFGYKVDDSGVEKFAADLCKKQFGIEMDALALKWKHGEMDWLFQCTTNEYGRLIESDDTVLINFSFYKKVKEKYEKEFKF